MLPLSLQHMTQRPEHSRSSVLLLTPLKIRQPSWATGVKHALISSPWEEQEWSHWQGRALTALQALMYCPEHPPRASRLLTEDSQIQVLCCVLPVSIIIEAG